MSTVHILAGRLLQQPRIDISNFDRIFVREMLLDCAIGVYPEEQNVTQKVSFTIEAFVSPTVRAQNDSLDEVPSYDSVVMAAIKGVVSSGHINLVETMAEQIASRILEEPRLVSVKVIVEKLENGPRRGVEIVRARPS
ncbi:MAG: dihydroneopterin aldolase [Hyphomicrobiaceae bacterium]|nr:dihydroneopterin aldolase [Hyphomicrobiaceae bacterium]